jgi:hypothetical protein
MSDQLVKMLAAIASYASRKVPAQPLVYQQRPRGRVAGLA